MKNFSKVIGIIVGGIILVVGAVFAAIGWVFKTIGNLIWFIVTGAVTALGWIMLGVTWCISIIGIPFGIQCFKFALLSALPFGKEVKTNFGAHPIANVIWIIACGFILALIYFIMGIIWSVTIIGLPFGKQCFKLAKLALRPFGAEVTKA